MARRSRYLCVALTGVLLLGGLATTVTGSASAGPTGRAALVGDLDRILSDTRLRGAQASVVVRSASSGEVLYNRAGADRLLPASNGKLLTSVAALEALGPDYRFTTGVLTVGRQRGVMLDGDLYLKGTGDPTVLAADYDQLARQVAAAGIRVVHGRLLADDTWFDDVRLGVSWAWDDEPYYYSAQISALSVAPNADFDAGTVVIRVTPGAASRPATVQVRPMTDHVRIDNRALTGLPGTAETITVEREHGGNTIVVRGSIPTGGQPVEEYSSVWNPTGYAADVFRKALTAHGVRVTGRTGYAPAPDGARALAQRQSIPLTELLVPFMKLSNNGHAEILVKAMGRTKRGEGSWDAGLQVLTERLTALGLRPEAYRMVDGSGLSRMDMVSAEQLSALLLAARKEPWFDVWYTSLPIAGRPDRMLGGTLRNRMRGTPAEGNVHAKTGSLTGVTALSGYVTAVNGEPLVFSVVLNNHLSANPRDIEDAIAVRLAVYRGEQDQATDRQWMTVPSAPPPADDPTTLVNEADLECTWTRAC